MIDKLLDQLQCWRAYRRMRKALKRDDLKTIADVKRELGLD